ncbi:hypothetical protein An01g08810 [Aspergillus niger]|uniref:Uncharacterized protein n=2 Tax=Aspergillus niger TaxID=5061 RepID=A2Q9R4_ASPNC|nr:hypothetical protein An01g08810 [Aspergillus niger]CAK37126.1 hypothetical protein An01g08810 [Aspergillus niger]
MAERGVRRNGDSSGCVSVAGHPLSYYTFLSHRVRFAGYTDRIQYARESFWRSPSHYVAFAAFPVCFIGCTAPCGDQFYESIFVALLSRVKCNSAHYPSQISLTPDECGKAAG